MKRRRKVLSVDKANVLRVFPARGARVVIRWRERLSRVETFSHVWDSAAMSLVSVQRFDDGTHRKHVLADILSDQAGGVGGFGWDCGIRRASAAPVGLYEPVHGSAPDIAAREFANPLGAILTGLRLLLRHSFQWSANGLQSQNAVGTVWMAVAAPRTWPALDKILLQPGDGKKVVEAVESSPVEQKSA